MPALKYTIQDFQKYAHENGGRCISKKYQPPLITLECSEGHRWTGQGGQILRNKNWCHTCSNRKKASSRRMTIDDARSFARKKGGKLLSKVYTGSRSKYLWECAKGHRWKTTLHIIKNTICWCPYCTDGSGEECVRICFQSIFRRRFPKGCPAWLVTRSGRSLELDGFNARIGVAFEHQGRMHYMKIKHFHQKKGSFRRRLALDQIKHRLCRQHGVRLVKIPEVGWKFPLERLLSEVIRRCRQRGIRVPAGAEQRRINYAPAMNMNPAKSKRYLKFLSNYARKRKGRFLGKTWQGTRAKYHFKCHRNHVFFSKMTRWCKRCAIIENAQKSRLWWGGRGGMLFRHKLKKSSEKWMVKIHAHAKKKGGVCLTKEWPGWVGTCRVRCGKCGRAWSAKPQNLMNGSWCLACATRKRHARNRAKHRSPAPA